MKTKILLVSAMLAHTPAFAHHASVAGAMHEVEHSLPSAVLIAAALSILGVVVFGVRKLYRAKH